MNKSTATLSVATVLLVLYILYERSQNMGDGKATNKSRLGTSRKARRPQKVREGCKNVKIDSPEFHRCGIELGVSRTTVAGNPERLANNINTAFVNDSFAPLSASAFPFRAKDGGKKLSQVDPLLFKGKGGNLKAAEPSALGAAVSPSAMGASREEMLQSSKRAVPTKVFVNKGGQLNLLHPLEQQ
ncbi:unnamed protein product [Ectocarpus sp. 6 AP-2014]